MIGTMYKLTSAPMAKPPTIVSASGRCRSLPKLEKTLKKSSHRRSKLTTPQKVT